jgi:ribonuclease BN (tRNA processing enzyme)
MGFSVTFLGTGAATPSLERGLSATITNIDQTFVFSIAERNSITTEKIPDKILKYSTYFYLSLHGDSLFWFGRFAFYFSY